MLLHVVTQATVGKWAVFVGVASSACSRWCSGASMPNPAMQSSAADTSVRRHAGGTGAVESVDKYQLTTYWLPRTDTQCFFTYRYSNAPSMPSNKITMIPRTHLFMMARA